MSKKSLDLHSPRVGYAKPPEEHRFKKGQSGNPRGRRRGSQNLTTLVLQELDSEVTVIGKNGKQQRISKRQAAAIQLVNQAAQGDTKALQFILDRFSPPTDTNPLDNDWFRSMVETLNENAEARVRGFIPAKEQADKEK